MYTYSPLYSMVSQCLRPGENNASGDFEPVRSDFLSPINKAYERLSEEQHRNNYHERPNENFQVQCLVLMRLVDRSMATGTPSSLHAMA